MKTILCPYFKNNRCTQDLDPSAQCNECPKNPDKHKCALTCDCEEETCDIGEIIYHD